MTPVRITVSFRDGVLDPAATAVERSLHTMGFDGASNLTISKQIDLTIDESDADKALAMADTMCKRLLVNEVMETYRIKIQKRAGSAK